jgi:thiosulfate/3-mercaptopyruvate sulfurtransferase
MKELDIGPNDTIVFYEASERENRNQSLPKWACRAAWIFSAYGHKQILILDGGLSKWKQESRMTSSDNLVQQSNGPPKEFAYKLDATKIKFLEDIHRLDQSTYKKDTAIIDGRPAELFKNGKISGDSINL